MRIATGAIEFSAKVVRLAIAVLVRSAGLQIPPMRARADELPAMLMAHFSEVSILG